MSCGFNVDRTIKEYKNSSTTLNNNQEWNNLRAIAYKFWLVSIV
jgi:hypothetical protein